MFRCCCPTPRACTRTTPLPEDGMTTAFMIIHLFLRGGVWGKGRSNGPRLLFFALLPSTTTSSGCGVLGLTSKTAPCPPTTGRLSQTDARDRLPFLVDTKSIGKPSTFSGKEDEWREWSVKFESFVVGVYGEEMRAVLLWATEQETELTEADVNQRFGTAAPAADQVE
eukprot:4394056-Amphidinium_carterae.2